MLSFCYLVRGAGKCLELCLLSWDNFYLKPRQKFHPISISVTESPKEEEQANASHLPNHTFFFHNPSVTNRANLKTGVLRKQHAKFSEKRTFPTSWYVHARVRIMGSEMFVCWKIWRALFSWTTRFEIRPFALLSTNPASLVF